MSRKYILSALDDIMNRKNIPDKLSSSTDSDASVIDLTGEDDPIQIPPNIPLTRTVLVAHGTSSTLSKPSIDYITPSDLRRLEDLDRPLIIDNYEICMSPAQRSYRNPSVNTDHLFVNKEENTKKPYVPTNYDNNPLLFTEKKEDKRKDDKRKEVIKANTRGLIRKNIFQAKPDLKRKWGQMSGLIRNTKTAVTPKTMEIPKTTENPKPTVVKENLTSRLSKFYNGQGSSTQVNKERQRSITCRDLDEALNLVFDDMRKRDPARFKVLRKSRTNRITDNDVKQCLKPILKELLEKDPTSPIIIDPSKPKSSPTKSLLSFPPPRTDPMIIDNLLQNPGAILQMCWFRRCRAVKNLKGCGECYLTYCFKHAPKVSHGCRFERIDEESSLKRYGAEHASRKVKSWGRKIDLKKTLPDCECMGLCIDCNFFYQYVRYFSGFATVVRKEGKIYLIH